MVLVLIFSLVLSSCSFIGPLITTEEEKRAQAILMTEGQVWQKQQEQKILEIAARLIPAAEKVEPLKFNFVGRSFDGWNWQSADSVNAWTDGGSVWITRGMMRFVKNENELALVVAHEMAHAYLGRTDYARAKRVTRDGFGNSDGYVGARGGSGRRASIGARHEKIRPRSGTRGGSLWTDLGASFRIRCERSQRSMAQNGDRNTGKCGERISFLASELRGKISLH